MICMTREERLSALWDFYKNDTFLRRYTLERYECDPFAPVIRLEAGVFCLPHLSPDRIAASNAYLVCGTERAMLIDTAYGIGDLKALCGVLTGLPVFVVNTHNHHDHTGGNMRFGSCFMHELDAGKPFMLRKPQSVTMLERNPENFYTMEDLAEPGTGEITPVDDGHIFDLGGGYEIEAFHLAGHTSGSMALLDRRRGILFTGDAVMSHPCSTMIVSFAGTSDDPDASVEAFRDRLEVLVGRMPEIRYLCPGHCAMQAEPSLIKDAYNCCGAILENPGIGGEARFRAGAKMHVCGGMSITYTESHIYRQKKE